MDVLFWGEDAPEFPYCWMGELTPELLSRATKRDCIRSEFLLGLI